MNVHLNCLATSISSNYRLQKNSFASTKFKIFESRNIKLSIFLFFSFVLSSHVLLSYLLLFHCIKVFFSFLFYSRKIQKLNLRISYLTKLIVLFIDNYLFIYLISHTFCITNNDTPIILLHFIVFYSQVNFHFVFMFIFL